MAVTPKGIYYPTYQEKGDSSAEVLDDMQAMAESVDEALDNVSIAIDNALSPTSTNPVQNKVIYETLENYQSKIDSSRKLSADLVDDTSTTNKFVTASEKAQITTNQNAIAGIKDGTTIDSFADVENALAGKQATLTFDTTPTESSTNPVTSGGIYTYVTTIVGDIESILEELDVGGGVNVNS